MSETIVRQRKESPLPVTLVHDEGLVRDVEVMQPKQRPNPIDHFVGQTDANVESWFLTSEPVTAVKSGSYSEADQEDLDESIRTEKQKKEKAVISSVAIASGHREEPATVVRSSESTTIVREAEPEKVFFKEVPSKLIVRKSKSQELLDEAAYSVEKREPVTQAVVREEVSGKKKTKKQRKESKSSSSSVETERQKISGATKTHMAKNEEPTLIHSAEVIEILDEPDQRHHEIVREIIQDREKELKARTGTPASVTASETLTASSSRTGARSKTPDGSFKTKSLKITRSSPPKTVGPAETKEYIYEDVVYTKPAKSRSKTPDTALRGATITTTRIASTSPEPTVMRGFSLDSREEDPETRIQSKTVTETQVREAPAVTMYETAEVSRSKKKLAPLVTREQVVETSKRAPGKKILKKQRSLGSQRSSGSSSSREETEEISSVTKSKLTSPTPEPRDEVQLVLAEMEASKRSSREVPEELHRTISPPLLHKVPMSDQEFTHILKESRVLSAEPEPAFHSHLKTPYMEHEITPMQTHVQISETIVSHVYQPREEWKEGHSVVTTTRISSANVPSTKASVTTIRGRSGSGSSSTETEDENGRKVRRKRVAIKTRLRQVESSKFQRAQQIVRNPVGHRDSDVGVSMIEKTTTEQLPSYISFGTVEPDSPQRRGDYYQSHEDMQADYRVRSVSPWSRDKILHRAGPKDYQVEYYEALVQEPFKPPRRDKEPGREFSTGSFEEGVFREVGRLPPSYGQSEDIRTETFVHSESSEKSRAKTRPRPQLESEEFAARTVSPSSESSTSARRAVSYAFDQPRTTSALSHGKTEEYLEEHVDVYRVKFAADLAEQRSKSPDLFKDPERIHEMRTTTLERTANSARNAQASPVPLALPYPPAYLFGREVTSPENETITKIKSNVEQQAETTDNISQLKELPGKHQVYAKPVRKRLIQTADSVEEDMIVADVRKITPEVGNLEFWTTSGGSSSGLEDERAVVHELRASEAEIRIRESTISDTTYAEIPFDTITTVRDTPTAPPLPEPNTLLAPSRVVRGGPARRSRSFDTPVYAKIHKKKEFLEEDVFYWKILRRKNRQSYSEERLRSQSPENLLTADEIAVLGRSISSMSGDAENRTLRKKEKNMTVTKRKRKSTTSAESEVQSLQTGYVSPPGLDDSGMYSLDGRERYSIDLRLTTTLGDQSADSSLQRRSRVTKQSPRSRNILTVVPDTQTSIQTRSFSPSSNEPLSGRDSPYETAESSLDDRAVSSSRFVVKTQRTRKDLLAEMESETILHSVHDDMDRVYRASMREPLPEKHSCLPAYNSLQVVVYEHLSELEGLIVEPDCQYIDQEILVSERQRFTALLDGLVRVNKDLDRLDELYRAMVNVESEETVWEIESKQRELNRLYMDLLSQLKSILRRIKHLQGLLDEYRRCRLHFKVQLLEELTYFRTHENMSEDDQRERVNRLLEEVLFLRYATYSMFVRSTPEFAAHLEEELHQILMLLRTELRGSIIQLLLTGRYSVEFDATEQKLILSSDDMISEIPTSTSRFSNPTVWSVLRRALPMQALALILLGFASLIPMTDDEFSCLFSNYFASSFNPALKFSGPPPI